jgi:transcriptional regulator with XRE-family HTH domain
MSLESILGANVKRLRKAAGLSQEVLASEVGVDMRYLGGIERGQENPSLAVLEQLGKALGVTVTLLLSEAGNNQTNSAG